MIKNTGGEMFNIQGLECYVPKKGYLYNPFTKKETESIGMDHGAIL